MRLSNPVLWERTCGDQLLADVRPQCEICRRILDAPTVEVGFGFPLASVFTECLFDWVGWNDMSPCLEHILDEHEGLLRHAQGRTTTYAHVHPLVFLYEKLEDRFHSMGVHWRKDEEVWFTVRSWIEEECGRRGFMLTNVWSQYNVKN